MKNFDIANMLGAFDRSLDILIGHLEAGKPDVAKHRAYEMKRAFRKVMGCLEDEKVSLSGKPPHGAIV